jgi:hypothetical protein
MTRPAFLSLAGVLLVATALAGCRSPRRQWTAPTNAAAVTTGGGQTVTSGGVVATGTPRQVLEQLDGVLRQQGFSPTGPAVHGNLATNGLIAYAVDAAAGSCYTLAVIGEDGSQNIDMIVLDPYGRPAAHNVRPDNHPWASFCAGSAGRFIARVQMAGGAGGYFYAVYAGPAGRQMELSSFYGEQAASQVEVAQMDGATQQRLGALDQQLGGQGFTRVGRPAGIVLNGREPRDFQLSLQQGQCYAFASLGGQGAVDTDLVLHDHGGEQLAADGRRDRDAIVQYCAPTTGRYALSVRMYEGQGPLFTVGYVQNAGQVQQAEPVIASTSTAHASLQENFALLDADMRARGYESYGNQTTGQLALAGTRNFEIQLEGGRCYAILAVGDASVRDLDLVLLGPNGEEVDRDIAQDPRPTVRVCPEATGNFYMQVRMTDGQGSYVYAPYRWPRGTSGAGLRGLSWIRLSEVTALLSVEGFSPDAGFSPEDGNLRRQGATASHNVDLVAGQCYAIVVVGGDGVHDLDVTLSQRGTQLTSDVGSRSAFPSIRHCATQDGRYSVGITAANGDGRYYMQVFSRTEQ